MVKLDRILINGDFEELLPDCMLHALSSEISDHCPLLLNCEIAFWQVRCFRFQNHWIKLEGFEEVVCAAWQGGPTAGAPVGQFAGRLQATATAVQHWQTKFCNNIKLKAAITSEIIVQLDRAMDQRPLTADERQFRANMKMQRLGYAALDRAIWRQKSRVRGVKEGDTGANFFRAKATARRCKNFIPKLQVDGVTVTDQETKVKTFHSFFEQIFGAKQPRPRRLNLQGLGYEQIELGDMDAPITEEEIIANIAELDGNRAPGPDGFTGLFYKRCWHIIKADLTAAIRVVQAKTTTHLHRLNQATMILLAKSADAATMKDYRPISLVCSFAKLITKILATRLQRRMNDMLGHVRMHSSEVGPSKTTYALSATCPRPSGNPKRLPLC